MCPVPDSHWKQIADGQRMLRPLFVSLIMECSRTVTLFVFAAFNFANAQRKAGVSLRQIKDGETTSRGMLVMGAPGRDTLTVSFPRSWGPLNSAAPNSPMGNGEVSMYFVSADCGHGQIVDFERMWADSLNLENHIVFMQIVIKTCKFPC